jgi:hypothetical protein
MKEFVKCTGFVKGTIFYKNGNIEEINFKNAVLRKGREALAKSITNNIGESFNFYINRMIFGDGGTIGGAPRQVSTTRTGLFGVTRANKPLIAGVNSQIPYQAVFTSVLAYSDANGYLINEMGLQMNNGDFYSLATFPGLNKTEQMQVVWNWSINYI